MKKLLYVGALSALLLAACGDEKEKEKEQIETSTEQAETSEPTQEELNAQLKSEAIPLDFVAANGDEVEKDTKVTITGEVSTVMTDGVGGIFIVTTTEGDGYGMYSVKNFTLDDVAEGQTVSVYGTYNGKDETSMPSIIATFIEQK